MNIEFGDNVRFIDNDITRAASIALKKGTCTGFTTPSMTKIDFIGDANSDYALSIEVEETEEVIWATQDLLEFLGHGKGQIIEIGNKRATRNADGSWKEEQIGPPKEKSKWFKKLFKIK